MKVTIDGSGNIVSHGDNLSGAGVISFPPNERPGFPTGWKVTGSAPRRVLVDPDGVVVAAEDDSDSVPVVWPGVSGTPADGDVVTFDGTAGHAKWAAAGGGGSPFVASLGVEMYQPALWDNPKANLVVPPGAAGGAAAALTNPAFLLTVPFTDFNGFGIHIHQYAPADIHATVSLYLVLVLVKADGTDYGVFSFWNPTIVADSALADVLGVSSGYAPLDQVDGTVGVTFTRTNPFGGDPGGEGWLWHVPDAGPWTAHLHAELAPV